MDDSSKAQEQLSLAWLDDSANDENLLNQQQLRLLDSNLKLLKNKDEFDEYLKSTDARITFIINGRLGEQLVPTIHNSPKIIAIYIFCYDVEKHKKWSSEFTEVKGVFNYVNELKKALQPKSTNTDTKKSIITSVPAPDLSPKPPTETLSICEVDDLYLISESCFDIISRMKVAPAEISDFFSLCQDAHKGNETLLAIIREFQERYSVDRAISLLNRDPFFYGYLDNLFKFAYVGGMIPCRVFIHDIQKQLEKHKCTSTVQVYQCELMTNEKFQKWKTFNGKIIAVKSFFLANSNRETITSYMADYGPSDAAHKRILFIIEANPQIKNVKLFAKIGSLSDYNDPNDVMFAIGSLFKITEIQDEKDGIINIKMSLCANDVNDSTVFMDYLKGQYIDLNGETDDIGFGRFLFDMGSQINRKDIFDTGEELIRSSLQKLTNDHPDLYRYYDALGDIDLSKSKLDSSLDCYQQSLKIKETKLQKNDLSFVDSYKNMALVYHQKKELKKAFEYFEELLKLWKILYGDEYASLPFCYTHMASIHEAEGRLPQAVSCYYQALSLMVKYCPESNLRLADVYHGLGRIHLSTERYHLASGYYHEALAIRLKSLPPQNPCIALTYKEIGLVYREMKSIQQSRENLDKAAAIYRQIHPSGDPLVTEIEDLIKNLPT